MSNVRPYQVGVFDPNDLLDRLLADHRRQGYDAGYQQALQDQLEGLVLQAERFLAGAGSGQVDRRALYSFVARLQEGLTHPDRLKLPDLTNGLGI
jgi:hypothetical protein